MSATAVMLQPSLKWSAVGSDFLLKSMSGADLFIAGYASVDMVDKQGDRIPSDALGKAFGSFMDNKAFRNVQLAHSGIQVGEVVAEHTDSQGRVWKSEVDDHGLFVVCKIRSDIQKAREVQKQIRDNELRAFSIGGQALFRVSKHTPEHGSHREITELELHEVTLCKKGINPEARYTILKMDETPEMNKMTDNAEALTEIRDGLARVLKHIDDEPTEEATPVMAKSNDDAVNYIDTLEKFAHEQGIDLDKLRNHYGLAKAYLPGDGPSYTHRGQGDEVGSGEDASEPTYPSLPAASGNKNVIKAPSKMNMNAPKGNQSVIKESEVTPEGLERGYRAYAGMRDEESLKTVVKSQWEERYQSETTRAMDMQKASDYSGQIAALTAEIATLRTSNTEIQKSAVAVPTSDIRIPSHEEFNAMGSDLDGWKAVEDLARRAIRGE